MRDCNRKDLKEGSVILFTEYEGGCWKVAGTWRNKEIAVKIYAAILKSGMIVGTTGHPLFPATVMLCSKVKGFDFVIELNKDEEKHASVKIIAKESPYCTSMEEIEKEVPLQKPCDYDRTVGGKNLPAGMVLMADGKHIKCGTCGRM